MKAGEAQTDSYRSMIFAQTEKRIQQLNEEYGQYFTSAHNEFSELTDEEFAAMYLGGGMSEEGSISRAYVGDTFTRNPNPKSENLNKENQEESEFKMEGLLAKAGLLNDVVPTSFTVDYSLSSSLLVTPVKNQGSCGSCWAFAGIAEIESYFLKQHKLFLDLSEQQMVDCLPAVQSGNLGCGGGYLDSVSYYATLYPIAQEKYYPYKAVSGACSQARINQGKTFKIRSYVYIYDCLSLANTLLNYKTIGVCGGIGSSWRNYASGVVPNCAGPSSIGGHCVLLVGASSDGTSNAATNFWKIQNSWGTGWGEQGFMRLARNPADRTDGPCKFCQ